MKRQIIAATVLGIAVSFVTLPAFADDSQPSATDTPQPLPAWYASSPAATYLGMKPDGRSETIQPATGTQGADGKVSYWGASGAAPNPGTSDITISAATLNPDRATLSIEQSTFASEVTQLADFVLLPSAAGEGTPVTVTLDATDVFTFVRPALPDSCLTVDDPAQYDFPAAALGANGHKYLVDFNVTFGERPASAYTACLNELAAKNAPSDNSSESNSSSDTGKSAPSTGHRNLWSTDSTNGGFSAPSFATPLTDFVRRALVLIGVGLVGLVGYRTWRSRHEGATTPTTAPAPTTPPAVVYEGHNDSELPLFGDRGAHIGGPTVKAYFASLPDHPAT